MKIIAKDKSILPPTHTICMYSLMRTHTTYYKHNRVIWKQIKIPKKKRNSYKVFIMSSFMNSTKDFSTCMRNDHAARLNQSDISFMLQKRLCLDLSAKMTLLLFFNPLFRVAGQCTVDILYLGSVWTSGCWQSDVILSIEKTWGNF